MEEDKEKIKKTKTVKKKVVRRTKKEVTELESNKKDIVLEEKTPVKEDGVMAKVLTKEHKTAFNLAEVIVIMIITALFSILIGSVVTYLRNDNGKQKYNSNNDTGLGEFTRVYNDILDNYYKDVDKNELIDSAIKGMIEFLGDPYSEYFDESSSKSFDERLEGEFVGMGAEISMNQSSKVVVTKLFEGSPAEKYGVLVGDIIDKVDGKDVTGLNVDEVAALIKSGTAGTKVTITVLRDSKSLDIEIVRAKVELTTAAGSIIEVKNKKVGLIQIDTFSKNTAVQFKKEYDKLKEANVTSLIVDVRDNFGGYLSVAKEIADYFLNRSDVVYQTDTKGKIVKTLSEGEKEIDLPVVVLVNNGSASASEILTAALKENLNINVVGTKTYGKGTVQKLYKLADGTSLKYTIQNWLTPKGNVIDAVGIEPTVNIQLDENYFANPSNATDNQLQKALELLTK